MFYNTNKETGDELKKSHAKAKSQEEAILELFKNYPTKSFTPFAVKRHLRAKWPITSIRRAMTNLTHDGELEKLTVRQRERYGKSNHLWALVNKEQIELF